MRLSNRGRNATSHRRRSEPLTGRCDHCAWHTVEESYPAVVKAYQDHLREEHPDAWVQA